MEQEQLTQEQKEQNLKDEIAVIQEMNKNYEVAINTMADIEKQIKTLEEQKEVYVKHLKEAMEEHNIKSWDTGKLLITYVAATTRETIDTTRLKQEQPDIAEKYKKVSNAKSSIRIKLR